MLFRFAGKQKTKIIRFPEFPNYLETKTLLNNNSVNLNILKKEVNIQHRLNMQKNQKMKLDIEMNIFE